MQITAIDVGCQGRISDGGVYNNSSLSNAIENNLLDLPPPRPLPFSEDNEWIHDHETECFPFIIVADDAFPLKPQIMKPYSHRNLDDKSFCLITEHQIIEGLQRMHLVSCHADVVCS